MYNTYFESYITNEVKPFSTKKILRKGSLVFVVEPS